MIDLGRGLSTSGRLQTEEEKAYLGDKITRRAFMQRLFQAERIAIRNSTDDNVVDIHEDLKSTDSVILSLQDTIDALTYLTSVGILASGRSDTILNDPVLPHEI